MTVDDETIVRFEDYIESLACKVSSTVKKKLLKELWGSNTSPFPKQWITSEHLLKISGQKYFDRRLRELRDECGCDIETGKPNGIQSWRLNSSTISETNRRGYLSRAQKKSVRELNGFTCAVCGHDPKKGGASNLEYDHKVPLSRGGNNELDNWQILCTTCNVAKRGSCKDCQDDCAECSWAYPNREEVFVPLFVDREIALQLKESFGHTLPIAVKQLIEQSMRND